jgi:hypothetical protein
MTEAIFNRCRAVHKVAVTISIIQIALFCQRSFGSPDNVEESTISEIKYEAALPSRSMAGRPLPLYSSWNTGELGRGFTPEKQINLIRQGHHVMPALLISSPDKAVNKPYFIPALEYIEKHRLPITLVSSQWEGVFFEDPRTSGASEQPPTLLLRGKNRVLNPGADKLLWTKVGNRWGSGSTLHFLQEHLTAPAKVIFLSNNEASKPRWYDAYTSIDLISQIPMEQRSPQGIRSYLNTRWTDLYLALIQGINAKLFNNSWKSSIQYVGFDALVPSYIGRYYEWNKDAQFNESAQNMGINVWGGASLPYYLNDWDDSTFYTVWSPQLEAMNYLPQLEQALTKNPGYWSEISIWDGHILKSKKDKLQYFKAHEHELTECRYAGFSKFGLWLLTPRVIREFRFYNEGYEEQGYAAEAIMKTVDELYADKNLQQFWRRGLLLENDQGKHPYNSLLPDSYKTASRWFLLESKENTGNMNSLSNEIKVFSIAIKISDQKQSKYLIYVFSPFLTQNTVTVTIPGIGDRPVNSSQCGAYTFIESEPSQYNGLTVYE